MYRQKQVEITEELIAQIELVTKTSIDPDSIVAFEAIAASTRPISKMGSMYNGAVMSRQLLNDMAEAVNTGSESVPLHTLHLQGDELPIGRVFKASVKDAPDGSANLHTWFYLPASETELVQKINLSVLDEVSVGVKSQNAFCSKCGFDYFGAEADFTYLFSQTCENGHTIGSDGTHLKLAGLDLWSELSLVSRGASNNPKILSRARNTVSQEAQDRMAASGTPVEAALLVTSPTQLEASMPDPIKPEIENLEPETSEDTTDEGEDTVVTPEGEDTPTGPEGDDNENAEFDAGAALAALQAQLEELANKLAPPADPEPTVESLQTELAAAQARISELEASAEEDVEDETPPKTEIQLDLPVGGVAQSTIEDVERQNPAAAGLKASAFKSPRTRK